MLLESSSQSPSPALFKPARNSVIDVFLTFAREERAPRPIFAFQSWNPYHTQREKKIEEKYDNLADKYFCNQAISNEKIVNILLACSSQNNIIMGSDSTCCPEVTEPCPGALGEAALRGPPRLPMRARCPPGAPLAGGLQPSLRHRAELQRHPKPRVTPGTDIEPR